MSKLKDIEKLKLSELCSEALSKIADKLKAEHSLNELPTTEIEVILKTENMGPKEHELFAEGKFSKYLSDTFGDRPYIVSNAFRAIMDFIKRRNNYEGVVLNENDLVDKKAVRKSDFRSMIARSRRIGDNQTWAKVESALTSQGLGVGKIRKYQSLWRAREIELLEYSNTIVQETQKIADQVMGEVIDADENATTLEVIDRSNSILEKRLKMYPIPFHKDQIMGLIFTSLINQMQ